MISCDSPESSFNSIVSIEARLVHEVVQTLTIELPLDFGKDSFDWLEFWAVTDVPDRLHVQLWPPLFDAGLFVDGRIVHEQ